MSAKRFFVFVFAGIVLLVLLTAVTFITYAWTPVASVDDPLVRMPGTQAGQITNIEGPDRCMNCHTDYADDPVSEPGSNWQGSMMAHSARDPLFWAATVVAGQDAIWAVGNPNAMDLCLRCHFPAGWAAGHSEPVNASAFSGSDYDGVQCDFCHRLQDPFFEDTYDGVREGSDWLHYWDETNNSNTPSQEAADETYLEDLDNSSNFLLFNTASFYGNDNRPFSTDYTENGGGQFFLSTSTDKRASFADAGATHKMLYSRYHKSKYFCNACHDVSNPVLANLGADDTQPLPSEENSAYSYYHVERTFSEFMVSDFGQQGGAAGIGPYAPDVFTTSQPNNYITSCQDCHMRDVEGKACDKNSGVLRPTESVEHPESGVPMHDLTGGNVWISRILASTVSSSPNYDAVNNGLLNQGTAVLTLNMNAGIGVNAEALLAGADRAEQLLQAAAVVENVNYDPLSGELSFHVQNFTGHKLISGYPEGRRMFVNIKAYADGALIHEVNPYDENAGTLKGLSYAYTDDLSLPEPLTANETYVDALVYEVKPSSSILDEDKTFHFVLADGRYKDNRIPPKGFRIDEASDRLIEPAWNGSIDTSYFTAAEYAGGYDAVALDDYNLFVPGADSIEINLYYQTTSREYVEFLRNEINGTNGTLSGTGAGGDPAYLVQTDPFFTKLKAWGDTIWQLWVHNMNVPGSVPILMTQAAWINPNKLTINVESETDALLAWPYFPLDCTFELYRDSQPYFPLNMDTILASMLPTGSAFYLDPGTIGSPLSNHFYRLRTMPPCNQDTNQVGEFDFQLVTGN